jgi:hypothetical protein
VAEVDNEVYREKHYSVTELSKQWNVSPDTIRRLFANEPGVLVVSNCGAPGKRRRYTTRLIPESVVRRVHLRLSIHSATLPSQCPQTIGKPQGRRNDPRT